jgi:predicted chitinase
LDPDVSGENQWRDLKGMPRRDIDDAADNEGELFKGRGFVQLTGRKNYADAARDLGLDLVKKPELAAQLDPAAKILVWYLKRCKKKVAESLEVEPKNYLEARAAINGKNKDGTVNGLDDFSTAYDLIEEAFNKSQESKKSSEEKKGTGTGGPAKS